MKNALNIKSRTSAIIWLIVIFLFTGFIILVINRKYAPNKYSPKAVNGIIDLTSFDFSKEKLLRIQGDVEFYWQQLLTPKDFISENNNLNPDYIFIPKKWNNLKKDGKEVGTMGYGTYRFKIIVPENNRYGLKIKEFESAYKIWVNGVAFGGAGEVGPSKLLMKPSRKRKEFYFEAEDKEIEVVLQVSNFQHRRGGATKPVLFGLDSDIMAHKSWRANIDYLLFGILLILFLYHLALYFGRRKDISVLHFSMLCLVMLLRMGTTGEKILLEIFPWLSYNIAMRIEYASFISIAPFICSYLYGLFPQDVNRNFIRWVTWISSIFVAFIFVVPVLWVTYTPLVFQVLSFVPIIYFPIVLFKAMVYERRFATLTMGSVILFYVFVGNDYLYYNKFTNAAYLMPFGTSIFAIAQAIVLSQKRSSDFRRIEILSDELKKSNLMLEERVEKRTKKVIQQKEQIESQNESLKKLASFKSDMTHMMVHDLKSPLTNIIGFSADDEIFRNSRQFIASSGWQLQNLINNILDVEKYDSTKMELKLQPIELAAVIKNAFEHTRFLVTLKSMTFENCVESEFRVNADVQVIERVFANIFSNAAKYGQHKGIIQADCKYLNIENSKFVKINIFNSGEPMESDNVGEIFSKYKQLHGINSRISHSTGIGLAYCKMAIEAHGGEIGVESDIENGVNIWLTLPC